MSVAKALLTGLLALIALAAAARVRSRLRPRPFPPWMTPILESPLRRLFFSRDETLARCGLAPGLRVLEVGPGAGYLTEKAAGQVRPGGRLVCLDVQMEMLRKVRARSIDPPPGLVCASGSQLPFRDDAFDLVFLVTVLGEIPDKAAALREYARILRPRGVLAVTEALPDPDYIRTPALERMARGAGFVSQRRIASRTHYTYRFTRPA